MHAKNLIEFIESIAPLGASCSWDSSGVQICSTKKNIKNVAVALDPTPRTISKAITLGADFILVHHPLLLKPQYLNAPSSVFDVTQMLLSSSTWLYAAHTSLDANPNGPAGFLAKDLKADSISVISPTYYERKFLFTITGSSLHSHISSLKKEGVIILFESEKMLSCIVEKIYFTSVIAFLGKNDLYYSYSPLEENVEHSSSVSPFGIGFILQRSSPLLRKDLFSFLTKYCESEIFSVSGDIPKELFKIGYCTGAGSSLIPLLHADRVDVFITGEIKHHHAIDTKIPLIDVGHHSIEKYMMKEMALLLQNTCRDINVFFISSEPPFRLMHKDEY